MSAAQEVSGVPIVNSSISPYLELCTASTPPTLPPTVPPIIIITTTQSVQKCLRRKPRILETCSPASSLLLPSTTLLGQGEWIGDGSGVKLLMYRMRVFVCSVNFKVRLRVYYLRCICHCEGRVHIITRNNRYSIHHCETRSTHQQQLEPSAASKFTIMKLLSLCRVHNG
jgi:hypothetical protein